MNPIISCPACNLRLRIPAVHVGKKIRCRACGTVIDTGAILPGDAAPAPEEEGTAPASGRGNRRGGAAPSKLHVTVKDDPAGAMKGVYAAGLGADGLRLSRGEEAVRVPVGVTAAYREKNELSVPIEGRAVTLAVGRIGLYNPRLARDIVAFLRGRIGPPAVADYAIPRPLMVLAFLPIGLMGFFLQGGAIGGAIGGALVGALVATNLGVVRQEGWPPAARGAACLGTGALGYGLLVALIFAIWGNPFRAGPAARAAPEKVAAPGPPAGAGEATAWGTPEDPLGDCRIEVRGESATIEVPGTVHNLTADPGQDNAPRVMNVVEGDFTVEVTVVGDVTPPESPASGSQLAFHGAGLLLRGEAGDFIRLERAAFVRNGLVRTYVLFEHHRPGDRMRGETADCPGLPQILKLQRKGGRVVGSFRTDGGIWRPFTPEDFATSRATVGIAAVNTASAPFRVRFEGFKVGEP